MKLFEKLFKKGLKETDLTVRHLYAKNGAQVGIYSLGVEQITYLDENGNKRTKLVWTAQR